MADARFDWFVILAGMRTGSNLLEDSLNAIDGLTCHGELFNPHFVGYPKRASELGFGLMEREADPQGLLAAVRARPGLNGFRYFHDHDPRILDAILGDPRCAKVILTRNPVESYVSLAIARRTGQWKLGRARDHKAGQATFDPEGFSAHLADQQAFQVTILRALQTSGQTAFYLDYEDVQQAEVLTGLARFLGLSAEVRPATTLLKQNPAPLGDLVTNPAEMEAAVARLDRFNLSRTPNFEPRRGPGVPAHLATRTAPVLFMPMRGGPTTRVENWLAGFGPLDRDFTQKTLRQWMKTHTGHRAFTVLSHPVTRAWRAFDEVMAAAGSDTLRDHLKRAHGLDLPRADKHGRVAAEARHRAFLGFLGFLRASLNGQTALRPEPDWASQSALLAGIAGFRAPDLLAREEDLAADLARLCQGLGLPCPPLPSGQSFADLAEIHDKDIEKAAQAAYQRDYVGLGFGPWTDHAA